MSPSRSRQVRRAQARRAQKGGAARSRPGRGAPDFLGKVPKAAWLALVALVVLVAAVVALVSGHSSSSSESSLLTGSGYPNVDTSNTRYVGGPIDSANVSKLETA
jgi:hypothetical protein